MSSTYIVRTKELTDKEIREYHRKRLLELSLKSLGQIPWLEEPPDEQKEWFIHRMRGSKRTWEVWNQ
jgi:hypothetical protein